MFYPTVSVKSKKIFFFFLWKSHPFVGWCDEQTKSVNMEDSMYNIVTKHLKACRDKANTLDKEALTSAVCKSFMESESYKHYVILIPVDLDDKFNSEQHESFNKHGFYQKANDIDEWKNMFFASEKVINEMTSLLNGPEEMSVDYIKDGEVTTVVVSLEGIEKTLFPKHFPDVWNRQ